MNTIAEILTNKYSDQGIQNLEIFYDSFIFNLKIKDSSANYNIILIEKFKFDYSSENIIRIKNSLTINFGNTGTDSPFYSNGNCFIKSLLNKKNKSVYITGLKQMQNGNSIPVVYLYDINNHTVENIFPKQSDIDNFNSFTNFSFKNDNIPIVNLINDKLYMVYQTEDGSNNYINSLIFKLNNNSCELINYEMVEYSNEYNIQFTNVNDLFLNYKLDNYNGILKRKELVLEGIFLDDNVSILSLDNSQFLGIDL